MVEEVKKESGATGPANDDAVKKPAKKIVKKKTVSKTSSPAIKSQAKPEDKPATKPTKKAPAKSRKKTTKTIKKAKSKPAAKTQKPKQSGVKAGTKTKNTVSIPTLKEMETMMTNQPFQFDKMAQEAANQSREGFEAFVKSGEIFAKGFEDIVKTAASLTQTAAEKQAEFAKELMGSKTLNELAETQNKIVQANFDQFMSNATKLSEMSVKVMNEASEPLNAQATKAMKKANKAA